MAKTLHPSFSLGFPSWWGIQLYLPGLDNSYYRGTRFDRAGVFGKITYQGKTFSDPWFDGCDPLRHDNVCGPSEEFGESGFEKAAPGDTFVKIGVGRLIRPDEAPYDHFRLYEVADPGIWECNANRHTATFRHILDGCYDYTKTVRISGAGQMQIIHELTNTGRTPLESNVYNHNFFTFGRKAVSAGRSILFPYAISGKWRQAYSGVSEGNGLSIDIFRRLNPGESVFMGQIRPVFYEQAPYDVLIQCGSSRGMAVRVTSPAPFDWAHFWANHRVACIEPFVTFKILPEESFRQELNYTFIPDLYEWTKKEAASRK